MVWYFPRSAAGYATRVQQAMLQVQQAMLKVQQAMLREIKNKANLSPAELELELSLEIELIHKNTFPVKKN